MKKQLLSLGAVILTVASLNAQSFVKNPSFRSNRSEVKKTNAATKQIAGSLVCNTQYVAGTTMDLNFTLTLTNADGEYCDLFSLTFPAGITPNTSVNNSDPFVSPAISSFATGTQLNAISGQTISWGTDDDANEYGGIDNATHTFTVNVTIAPGTTGNKVATFIADGDSFVTGTATAGDLNGSATIYPVGATTYDVKGYLVFTANMNAINNCGMSVDTIVGAFINSSNAAISNVPVKYSINGGTPVSSTIAGPVAIGDTAYVLFGTQENFSAQGIYSLKAWADYAGDISQANDTAKLNVINSLPINFATTEYSNGIESAYDYESIKSDWIGDGVGFGYSTTTKHSGAQALFYTVNTGMGAPAGTYETFAILPCMDVVSGRTYRISYWRKSNNSPAANGQTGVFVGTTQDAAAMTTVVKAYSAITPNPSTDPWQQDSVDYVATATGTVYFAIGAKGTVATGNQINVRLDDIKIKRLSAAGIDENSIFASVYPNPANDVLNFDINGNATSVSIIGLDGKVYSTTSFNGNSTSVNVASLASGIYVYEIVAENGSVTRSTFVKK
jgi:hypothetical protein